MHHRQVVLPQNLSSRLVDQVAKMEALPELFPLVLVVVPVAVEELALVVELVAQEVNPIFLQEPKRDQMQEHLVQSGR